ncbi:MAG: hypothetical protein BWY86_00257 [Candidatus Aminicenantes bacterium ADurb.Bin508]|nr:MAG: hypothetical protein BWY86_00257 [Candidatus Aminicenantes bacterium ADurb.Bin508]
MEPNGDLLVGRGVLHGFLNGLEDEAIAVLDLYGDDLLDRFPDDGQQFSLGASVDLFPDFFELPEGVGEVLSQRGRLFLPQGLRLGQTLLEAGLVTFVNLAQSLFFPELLTALPESLLLFETEGLSGVASPDRGGLLVFRAFLVRAGEVVLRIEILRGKEILQFRIGQPLPKDALFRSLLVDLRRHTPLLRRRRSKRFPPPPAPGRSRRSRVGPSPHP